MQDCKSGYIKKNQVIQATYYGSWIKGKEKKKKIKVNDMKTLISNVILVMRIQS